MRKWKLWRFKTITVKPGKDDPGTANCPLWSCTLDPRDPLTQSGRSLPGGETQGGWPTERTVSVKVQENGI